MANKKFKSPQEFFDFVFDLEKRIEALETALKKRRKVEKEKPEPEPEPESEKNFWDEWF